MSESAFARRLRERQARPALMLPLALAIAALVSAVMVVQVKNDNRRLTTASSELRAARDAIDVEWSQLQLEEAAHSSHSRIETIARNQLKMVEPRETVMVTRSPAAAPGAAGEGQ